MIGFLKKNQVNILYSPVIGKSIPLTDVPDMVFANKLMGDGIAFAYAGDTVYAPCDGEVMLVASTKHALGLKTKNGMELLLHIGMDTVNLNGEGFEVFVKKHQLVKAKDKLFKIDRKFMDEKGMNLITPLVIVNAKEYELDISSNQDVDLESVVISAKKK